MALRRSRLYSKFLMYATLHSEPISALLRSLPGGEPSRPATPCTLSSLPGRPPLSPAPTAKDAASPGGGGRIRAEAPNEREQKTSRCAPKIGNESVPIQLAQCRFPGLLAIYFPVLKYKHVSFNQIKYTEAVLSNSTRKLCYGLK